MTKSNQEILDACKGSILGAAVGDALGAGYEFTKPDDSHPYKRLISLGLT